MLCHKMFYGAYVGDVVGKSTRECGCCMANVGIRCYVIFQEVLSKWTYRSIHYISLSLGEFVLFLTMRFEVLNLVSQIMSFICFCGSVGLICLCKMLVLTCSFNL